MLTLVNIINHIVMNQLSTMLPSEKYTIRWADYYVNAINCTCTNLHRVQISHSIWSLNRIKIHSKHKIHKIAATVACHMLHDNNLSVIRKIKHKILVKLVCYVINMQKTVI